MGSQDMVGVGSGLFPVAHSVFSAETLVAEVTRDYAVATPCAFRLLRRGLNDTYILNTQDERYIVRVYGASWRTGPDVAYELELLGHLASRQVPASVPVAARDGSLSRQVCAPEGARHLVMFTYARGTPLWWTDEHGQLAGRMLAAIHTASDDFVSKHARFQMDLEYLIDRPLAAIRPFLIHRPEDLSYLERFAGELKVQAAEAVRAGLDWGVCHGDFGGNIHIADRALTVFDFDLCGSGWRAYDFVVPLWAARSKKRTSIWDAFVRGYTERRRLGAADLEAIQLFSPIRHLWTTGIRLSNLVHWGILPLINGHLEHSLKSFREWEVNHMVGR